MDTQHSVRLFSIVEPQIAMARNQQLNGGFTLIEVLVVVAVIALLVAIAIPNYAKARVLARRVECRENRRQIQGAKTAWALEHRKSGQDVPSDSDLFGPTLYLARKPTCPAGGEYSLNAVDELITCSDPDHHATPEDIPTATPQDSPTTTPEDISTATPQDTPTGTPQGHGKGTPKGKAKGKLSSTDERRKPRQHWSDLPGDDSSGYVALGLKFEAAHNNFDVADYRSIFAMHAGRVRTTLWGALAIETAEPGEAISGGVAQGFAQGFAACSLHGGVVEAGGNPGDRLPQLIEASQSFQVPSLLYDGLAGGEKADETEFVETIQQTSSPLLVPLSQSSHD